MPARATTKSERFKTTPGYWKRRVGPVGCRSDAFSSYAPRPKVRSLNASIGRAGVRRCNHGCRLGGFLPGASYRNDRFVLHDVSGVDSLQTTIACSVQRLLTRISRGEQRRVTDALQRRSRLGMVRYHVVGVRLEEGHAAHFFNGILHAKQRQNFLRRVRERRCERDRKTRLGTRRSGSELRRYPEPQAIACGDAVHHGTAEVLVRVYSP